MLVELNLLSNQDQFKIDGLFSIGLTRIFTTFTQGYKPSEQQEKLLPAVCKATDITWEEVRDKSAEMLDIAKKVSLKEIKDLLKEPNSQISGLIREGKNYTRIKAIGLYEFSKELAHKESDSDENSIYLELTQDIGYKKERLEKDIAIYKSNIDKIQKALDLIEINIKEERRRREKK